jgi:hypothetical protein
MYYGLASVDEYAALLNVRHYQLFGPIVQHLYARSSDPSMNQYCRKIFSMLNVKYILSTRPLPELNLKLLRDGPLKLYGNPDVWPRAFMAAGVVVCEDDEEVLRQIRAADCQPLTVFMPRAEIEKLPPEYRGMPGTANTGRPRSVSIERYSANRVVMRVQTDNDGLLVLSDTWFPGWTAKINGSSTPVLRVNHTLRAVALNAGNARVEFIYRPLSFIAGIALSAVTFLVLLAYLLIRRPA